MAQVKDPVCGMTVDSSTAKERATYEGTEYVFCSESCRQKFQSNPQQYAKKA